MWQWVAVALVAYLVLMVLIVAVAASGRAADREERAVFARWRQERLRAADRPPALRDEHRPRAA